MIERVCRQCQAGNPVDSLRCAMCGAVLEQPLARRPVTALARQAAKLPERWQRGGKAIALGAIAIAVEAGAAWLKQRAERPSTEVAPESAPRIRTEPRTLVARQRVWETYDQGQLTQRVVEQTVWRFPDSNE